HTDFRDLVFLNPTTLIATSDGGIFFLRSPISSVPKQDWGTLNGYAPTGQALGITELTHIAYDSNANVIIGGSLDNRTENQVSAGSVEWDTVAWGDGGVVRVDEATLAAQNQSIRYSSAHHLADFRRQIFDADNNRKSDLVLFPGGGKFPPDFQAGFMAPVALDAIAPTAAQLAAGESTRLVIGGANGVLYEANNAGTAATREAVAWTKVTTAPGLGF